MSSIIFSLVLTLVVETETCELCAWSGWNEWTHCPVTCLHANQVIKRSRKRFCTAGGGSVPSMQHNWAPVIESDECNQLSTVQFDLELCPVPPW